MTKFDIIIIIVVLSTAAAYLLRNTYKPVVELFDSKIALVYQDNTLLKQLDLKEDKVIPLLNGRVEVEVRKGKIRILKTDCAQGLCRHQGWLGQSGQAIICVPNKLFIEIKSPKSCRVDAICY